MHLSCKVRMNRKIQLALWFQYTTKSSKNYFQMKQESNNDWTKRKKEKAKWIKAEKENPIITKVPDLRNITGETKNFQNNEIYQEVK